MNYSSDHMEPSTVFSDQVALELATKACEGDAAAVRTLISEGADVNHVGKWNVTPLIWTLTCRGIEFPDGIAKRAEALPRPPIPTFDREQLLVLDVLLQAGADPNHQIDGDFGPVYPGGNGFWIDKYSPVLIAAEFHDTDVLKLLLQFGGDPNARDGDGEDTIHFERHGAEVANQLGIKSYSVSQYVDDANWVIQNGRFAPEINAYVSVVGGPGSAKGLMVGLDRATGEITTMHLKQVGFFEQKAPSLGRQTQPKSARRDTVGPNLQAGWKWPY